MPVGIVATNGGCACILKASGIKPQSKDLKVVELQEGDQEDLIVDLTLEESVEEAAGEEAAACRSSTSRKVMLRAVYVKDVMGALVAPELQGIRKFLPGTYALIKAQGHVDIVLAIDNTSRTHFSGHSSKLEQAVIKIILPGIDSAQQSPCLAIPIFFMEGTPQSMCPSE